MGSEVRLRVAASIHFRALPARASLPADEPVVLSAGRAGTAPERRGRRTPANQGRVTSLTRSALSGTAWNYSGAAVLVVIQVASTAATARLVEPSQFGLYATAQAAAGVFGYFTLSAVAQGLLRRPHLSPHAVGTATAISVTTGSGVARPDVARGGSMGGRMAYPGLRASYPGHGDHPLSLRLNNSSSCAPAPSAPLSRSSRRRGGDASRRSYCGGAAGRSNALCDGAGHWTSHRGRSATSRCADSDEAGTPLAFLVVRGTLLGLFRLSGRGPERRFLHSLHSTWLGHRPPLRRSGPRCLLPSKRHCRTSPQLPDHRSYQGDVSVLRSGRRAARTRSCPAERDDHDRNRLRVDIFRARRWSVSDHRRCASWPTMARLERTSFHFAR